jgi:phage baseplate assembly protein W
MSSSIKLNELSAEPSATPYQFKDIALDVRESKNLNDFGLYQKENVTDIESSLDQEAISNSIDNIFNTTPGEKILNPAFGLNLKMYLFDPLSYDTAENIADMILLGIRKWEPRVNVKNVNVTLDIDQHQYEITLRLEIPSLNNNVMVKTGILNNSGYKTS